MSANGAARRGGMGAGEPAAADGTIRFRERWQSAGYTSLPNVVLRSKRLNNTAKVLYGLLLSYAWEKDHAWPGQETLAAHLDATARTVRNALADLKAAGLITVEQRGLRQTNVYWIESLHAFAAGEPGVAAAPASAVGAAGRAAGASHFRTERQKTAAPERQGAARQERQRAAAKAPSSQADSAEQPHAPSTAHHPAAGPVERAHSAGQDDVVALLLAQGVTARVAQTLLAQHGTDAVRQQLQWHQARPRAKNPAGALVQAIREQWAPPPAWLEARARAAAAAREVAAAAEREAEAAARRRRQEALTPEERVAGPLLLWTTRQRLHGREPTPAELDARRAELLAQLHAAEAAGAAGAPGAGPQAPRP